MKNPFKKHLTIFQKSTRKIIIERTSEYYYISDGVTLLRLPVVFYVAFARPASPLFLELQDGTHAVKMPADMLPEVCPGPGSLADIWERTKAPEGVTVTRLLFDDPDSKRRLRYVITSGKPAVFDDAFIAAASEYSTGFNATADNRFPALKWEAADGTGCIIMPVNSAPARMALPDLLEVIR